MPHPDDAVLAQLQDYFRNRQMRSTFSALTELLQRRAADPSPMEIAALEADLESKLLLAEEFPPGDDPSFDDLELTRCISGLKKILSFYGKHRDAAR